MARARASRYTCCQLSDERNYENYMVLKSLLLTNIWSYFEVFREGLGFELPTRVTSEGTTMTQLSSLLISASISGCTDAVDFLLDANRQNLFPDIPVTHIINNRVPCRFCIPDSLNCLSECFAMTPLHFACWRLDIVMIQKLLGLGANPNSLAWEKASKKRLQGDTRRHTRQYRRSNKGEILFSGEEECTCINSQIIPLKGMKFDSGYGLSPLHFVVLGLRFPPRSSLSCGSTEGLIHNVYDSFERASRKLESERNDRGRLFQSARKVYPEYTLQKIDIRNEIVKASIQLLLSVGANPNPGHSSFLNFYFPLDVLIQPPLKLFNGTKCGLSRRTNFESNIAPITTAVQAFLHGGSKLSPKFLSIYRWSLESFDCFHAFQPRPMYTFIELLLFCGPFPAWEATLDPGVDRQTDRMGFSSNCGNFTCNKNDIKAFLVEACRASVRHSLLKLIMDWCSMSVLHLMIQTGREFLRDTQWPRTLGSISYLWRLVELALCVQSHPLKHLCKLVILRTIKFDVRKIDFLPLPPFLLCYLKVLRHKTNYKRLN